MSDALAITRHQNNLISYATLVADDIAMFLAGRENPGDVADDLGYILARWERDREVTSSTPRDITLRAMDALYKVIYDAEMSAAVGWRQTSWHAVLADRRHQLGVARIAAMHERERLFAIHDAKGG